MENPSWNEYLAGAAGSPGAVGWPQAVAGAGGSPEGVGWPQAVAGVMLLGVRVTAYAVINVAEHRRREAAGVGAVLDPALLDRSLDQPAGVAGRLESPLAIAGVVVRAGAGRELRAVQDASLFAGFTHRWVAGARGGVPDVALLEAKACGVGIIDAGHRVLLTAEEPVGLIRDGWSWLLEEKVYRRWLGARCRDRGEVQPLAEPA